MFLAGFVVLLGCPTVEIAGFEYMEGPGGVLFVGAGAAVLGFSVLIEEIYVVNEHVDFWINVCVYLCMCVCMCACLCVGGCIYVFLYVGKSIGGPRMRVFIHIHTFSAEHVYLYTDRKHMYVCM